MGYISSREPHVLADGAAAVANLSASSGNCKAALLDAGVTEALVAAVVASTRMEEPHACAQLCRALGNLCYGWGPEVEAAKEIIERCQGPRAVVEAMKRFDKRPDVVRWGAHACRNLSVRSEATVGSILPTYHTVHNFSVFRDLTRGASLSYVCTVCGRCCRRP